MALDTEKDKKQKFLAIGLVLLLVPLLLYNFSRHRRTEEQKARFQKQASSPIPFLLEGEKRKEVAAKEGASSSDLVSYQNGLVWKRDPFVLGGSEEGKGPALQLKVSGIIFDDIRPEATYAILNEEVVRIGDDFHGIKVVDIQPDYVRLKKFDQELILYLYQTEKVQ